MNERITFAELLRRWAESVKGEIKQQIIATDTIKTGNLLRSADYTQQGERIQFSMLDYGVFTDEGTRNIAPRYFFDAIIRARTIDLERQVDRELEEQIDRVFAFSNELSKKWERIVRTGITSGSGAVIRPAVRPFL
jgi:hypothetical protein